VPPSSIAQGDCPFQPIVLAVKNTTCACLMWLGGKLPAYPAVGPDRVVLDYLRRGSGLGLGLVSYPQLTLPPLGFSSQPAACTTSLYFLYFIGVYIISRSGRSHLRFCQNGHRISRLYCCFVAAQYAALLRPTGALFPVRLICKSRGLSWARLMGSVSPLSGRGGGGEQATRQDAESAIAAPGARRWRAVVTR